MDVVLISVILVIGLALLFDFTNGFHDAANATSTVVATKAMRPRPAVLTAAVFNFLPALAGSTLVANTVAKTVDVNALPSVAEGVVPFGIRVTFGALLAAIFWNYLTWSIGMPSSSSHALIGGLVGAGLAAGGTDVVSWDEVIKTAMAILLSPAVAFTIAFIAMYIVDGVQKIFKLKDDAEPFRWAQIGSMCAVAWGHGSNDAQKTMGVIAATLGAAGYLTADADGGYDIPTWVVFTAASMITLGTLWGGWAIIETMGLKITRLKRSSGVAANVGAATAIFGASNIGVPISTTHAAASSVIGAGVASGRGVNYKIVGEMSIAWVLTVPAAGTVGFLMYQVTTIPGIGGWVASLAVVFSLGAWATMLMMRAENADDVEAKLDPDEELTGEPEFHAPHFDLSPQDAEHIAELPEHDRYELHPEKRPPAPSE